MKKFIFLFLVAVLFVPNSSEAQGSKTFFGPEKGKLKLRGDERSTLAIKEQSAILNEIKAEQANTTKKVDELISEFKKQNNENRKVTLKVLQELVKILGEQNEILKQVLEASRKK